MPAPAKAGVLPPTRAEVSSEPTTGLARTASAMGAAAASKGTSARARILAIAPLCGPGIPSRSSWCKSDTTKE